MNYVISDKRLRYFLTRRLGSIIDDAENHMNNLFNKSKLPYERWALIFVGVVMDGLHPYIFENGPDDEERSSLYHSISKALLISLDPMMRRIYYSDENS